MATFCKFKGFLTTTKIDSLLRNKELHNQQFPHAFKIVTTKGCCCNGRQEVTSKTYNGYIPL